VTDALDHTFGVESSWTGTSIVYRAINQTPDTLVLSWPGTPLQGVAVAPSSIEERTWLSTDPPAALLLSVEATDVLDGSATRFEAVTYVTSAPIPTLPAPALAALAGLVAAAGLFVLRSRRGRAQR
jgi:hypothetical protein